MKPCTCFCEQIDHLVDFACECYRRDQRSRSQKLMLWHWRQFVSESGGRHDRRFSIECEKSRCKAERAGREREHSDRVHSSRPVHTSVPAALVKGAMGKKKGGGKQAKGSAGGGKKKRGGKYAAMEDENSDDASSQPRQSQGRRGKKKTRGGNKARNQQMMHDDDAFRKTLLAQGSFSINEMAADGNCLFRSLSDQLFGDYGNRHDVIRQNVCSFLEDNEEEFAVFLLLDEHDEDVADFDTYVGRMKEDGEWGGNVELVAAARFYRRTITVYSPTGAFSIESGHDEESGDKLLLSYHGQDHYNSIRDENTKIKPMSVSTDTNGRTKNSNGGGGGGGGGRKKKKKKDKSGLEDDEKKDDFDEGTSRADDDKSHCDDEGDSAVAEDKQQQNEKPEKTLRKNNPCPCGSGLRYKKCCLAAEKSKARAAKWKEKHGINGDDGEAGKNDSEGETDEVEGSFRVLKI